MLRYVDGFIGANNHSAISNFFINLGWWGSVNILHKSPLKFLFPDLVIMANSSRGTSGVYSTVFHEMAHASHFTKVGSYYWSRYISYIITYGNKSNPYGDGHGRNAGYCGVGEMWGYYFEDVCFKKEFGYGGLQYEDYKYWFNPGFIEKVAKIPDVTTSEIYSCLTTNTTTFKELKRKLKTKTIYDEKIDEAYNYYTDWP